MKFIKKSAIVWLVWVATLVGLKATADQGPEDVGSADASLSSYAEASFNPTALIERLNNGRVHLERCCDYANDSRFEC